MKAIEHKTKLSRWGIVTVAVSLSMTMTMTMTMIMLTPNATFAAQRSVSIGSVGPARSAPGLPIYLAGSALNGVSAIHFDTESITWVYTGKVTQIGHNKSEVSFITPKLGSGNYKVQIVTTHGTSGTKALTVVQDDTLRLGESCAAQWIGYELHGSGGKLIACGATKSSARWVAPSQLPRSTHPILATPIAPKPVPVSTPIRTTSTSTTTTTTVKSTSTTTTTLAPAGPYANAIWSGYVVPTAAPVTSVSGTWTIPQLNCSTDNGDSFTNWDGIGGVGTQLLQTGINAYCEEGVQTTQAWWQLIPPDGVFTPFVGFAVSPGDVVEGSIYQANGAWVTRLDDLTTGISGWMITNQGYGVGPDSSNGQYVSQGTLDLTFGGGNTAEWIVEDAGYAGVLTTLANFGTLTFSNLQTNFSPFTLTPGEEWEVVANGTVVLTPSAPTSSGFSVSYTGP